MYPLAGGFWAFLAVLTVEALAEVVANSGRAVYTAAALPREIRVRAMAFNRAYLNVGFTVGSGLDAAALALDSRRGLLLLVLTTATELWSSAARWFFQTEVPPPEQRGVYIGASRSVSVWRGWPARHR